MNTISYSPDGGKSWVGPLSPEEFAQLKSAGMILPEYIVRGNDGQDDAYYLMINGKQQGPFSVAVIRELLENGRVTPAVQTWKQGMSGWIPLSEALPSLVGKNAAPSSAPKSSSSDPQSSDPQSSAAPQSSSAAPAGPDVFSFSYFFSSIFARHTQEEMVDFFCAGSSKTTPQLKDVSATWPGPWVFARVLLFFVILCAGLYWGLNEFHNTFMIPAIIMVGSMSVPLCVLLLVYEMNIQRDVPFYTVMKSFMLGGVLSILFTMVLHSHLESLTSAYWAGPIEETAKLLAVLLVASTYRKNGILTGVLLGCAIGAGFAVFETMGYVFGELTPLVAAENMIELMQQCGVSPDAIEIAKEKLAIKIQSFNPDAVLLMRGLHALATHAVWTAITAGAFWMVLGEKVKSQHRSPQDVSIDTSVFGDARFLRIACVPVALHMVWNSSLFSGYGQLKFAAIGVVGWMILLRLVQRGINQVKEEKRNLGY